MGYKYISICLAFLIKPIESSRKYITNLVHFSSDSAIIYVFESFLKKKSLAKLNFLFYL